MKFTLTLPALDGLNDEDGDVGVVAEWRKEIGDAVLAGEVVAVVGRAEVASPVYGILHRKAVLPGEAVEVGEPLAVLSGVPASLVTGQEKAPNALLFAPAHVPLGPEEAVTLSPADEAVARHAARSVQASPHVFTVDTADVTEAMRLAPRVGGSLLPLVIAAASAALARHPALNSQFVSPREVRRKRYVHVAVALRTAEGATAAPVLRDADRKSPLGLARELDAFRERAEAGTLTAPEQRGATFTVREGAGVAWQTPILHQPQAAQLSFGAVRRAAMVRENESVVAGWAMDLCLAHDARLVREDEAAAFLREVKANLEEARFLFG